MKARILKALEAIGAAIVKIVFSRKFLALVGVLLLGWKAFEVCVASENPLAWIFFGLIALFLVAAFAAYVWANVKAKKAIIPPVEPPEA